MSTPFVPIEFVGKCQWCGEPILLREMSPDAAIGNVPCLRCQNLLTPAAFGHDESGHKIRWIGPDGEWTETRPTGNFILSGVVVVPVIARGQPTVTG